MVCEIRDSVRSSIFWGFVQRIEIIHYRLFGKTYRSLLQGSRNLGTAQMSLGLIRNRSLKPRTGIKYSQFPEGIPTLMQWSRDSENLACGSIATGWAPHAGEDKGGDPDEQGYPGVWVQDRRRHLVKKHYYHATSKKEVTSHPGMQKQ